MSWYNLATKQHQQKIVVLVFFFICLIFCEIYHNLTSYSPENDLNHLSVYSDLSAVYQFYHLKEKFPGIFWYAPTWIDYSAPGTQLLPWDFYFQSVHSFVIHSIRFNKIFSNLSSKFSTELFIFVLIQSVTDTNKLHVPWQHLSDSLDCHTSFFFFIFSFLFF